MRAGLGGGGTARGAEVWAALRHYSLVEKQWASWMWGGGLWPKYPLECLREFFEGVQIKGCVQEALQLCQMGFLVARGWSSCWIPASIPEREGAVRQWTPVGVIFLSPAYSQTNCPPA